MEQVKEKRRGSILKKRRSRSMSPNSPKEQAARRASRRISFSGKHNVREFFTNESTAIAWGETYDVSAEKHISSNEQITLQSTRFSSMSQTTRNDSAGMDISTISNNVISVATKSAPSQERVVNFKPITKNASKPIPVDEKENYAVLDDMDLTLELPPPAPPTKSFSSKAIPSIFSSSLRPSFSNSITRVSMAESSHYGEKTSGSDNMDISGIEPADQNEVQIVSSTKRASEYLKSLKNDNNFVLKNQQNIKSQMEDIQLDKTLDNNLPPGRSKVEVSSRKTINQPLEMSLEVKNQTKLKDVSGSFADMSIEALLEQANGRKTANTTNAIDMEMSHLKPSSCNQVDAANETFKKPISRRTVNISHDITTDDFNASKINPLSRPTEISINFFPSNMETSSSAKSFRKPNNRRTVNEPHDMTTDETNASNIYPCNRMTEMSIQLIRPQDINWSSTGILQSGVHALSGGGPQDISLDDIHIESKPEQQNLASGHSVVEKRSSRRQTILQDQDMDLESPLKQPYEVTARSSKAQSRQTINKPQNISVDFTGKGPQIPKIFAPLRRQTTHTVQDISLEMTTPTSNVPLPGNVSHCACDISLDEFQLTDSVQRGNRDWKKGVPATSRVTINEPRDMSFDSNATGKSNAYSRYDKTILGDMSMELQSTDVNRRLNRKSVICKSPSKDAFDQSSLEYTKLIDQNNLSYHPLHITKLNDRNSSKFSEFELNTSAEKSSDDIEIEQNDPEPPPLATADQGLGSFKRKLNLFAPIQSQTDHSVYDLDISEDSSPISTAKKFNLNKTPYYAELDRDSDSSSLELTNNNFNDENQFETNKNEQPSMAASKQCSETKIFHATINDDSNHLSVAFDSMESGRISPASVPLERPKSLHIQLMQNNSKRSSMPNQSLFQLSSIGSPIQIDDSTSTTNSFNNLATTNLANVSVGANDSSKQLTFIEDDDDEDQICNTKIDLASSLENSENESMLGGLIDLVKPMIASTSAMITSTDQLNPSLCKELIAFKKSNRLRHSNVFDTNEMSNESRTEASSTFNDESAKAACNSNGILADIGQSQIMQRRSNNTTANDEANETSFLQKRPAKKASEVKLDFSGYDELAGLATPMDVFEDFLQRMEQIDRQNEIWAEQYRKFEAGEIDSFDDNNNDDPNSQNVEAPSWTFLYKNMLQEELEEQQRELEREWNESLPGAHLPAIPSISLIMLEKCRQLNHWTFNDTWYFHGNIHLYSKEMLAFRVCLVYDSDEVEMHGESYGAIQFDHIEYEFCKEQLSVRRDPIFSLQIRELKSKLPRDLTPMCKTSTNLSEFDEKLHGYCVRARQKVKRLKQIWRKNKALIKEEDGTIFIMKTMFDFKNLVAQDFIIKLDDIDTTDWRNVLTNPSRTLNEEVKNLPRGVAFIEELLTNCSKYVPLQ